MYRAQVSMESLLLLAGVSVMVLVIGSYMLSAGVNIYSEINALATGNPSGSPSTGSSGSGGSGGSSGGSGTATYVDVNAAISVSATSVTAGSSITVTLSACNNGTDSASGTLYFIADGSTRQSWSFSNLSPGNCSVKTTSYTVNEGTHTLEARVSAAGDVDSSNDSDSVTVTGTSPSPSTIWADINVDSVSLSPQNPREGDSIVFSAVVCNPTVYHVNYTLRIYYYPVGHPESKHLVEVITASNVPRGCKEYNTEDSPVKLPAGDYVVEANVYYTSSSFADPDTSNNVKTLRFTVIPASVFFCSDCASCKRAISNANNYISSKKESAAVVLTSDIVVNDADETCIDFSGVNVLPETPLIFDGNGHTVELNTDNGMPVVYFDKSSGIVLRDLNLWGKAGSYITPVYVLHSTDINFDRVVFGGSGLKVSLITLNKSNNVYFLDSNVSIFSPNPHVSVVYLFSDENVYFLGGTYYIYGNDDNTVNLFAPTSDTNGVVFDSANIVVDTGGSAIAGGKEITVRDSNLSIIERGILLKDVNGATISDSILGAQYAGSSTPSTCHLVFGSSNLQFENCFLSGCDVNVSGPVYFANSRIIGTVLFAKDSDELGITESNVLNLGVFAVRTELGITESNVLNLGVIAVRTDVNIQQSEVNNSTIYTASDSENWLRIFDSNIYGASKVIVRGSEGYMSAVIDNVYFSVDGSSNGSRLDHLFNVGTKGSFTMRNSVIDANGYSGALVYLATPAVEVNNLQFSTDATMAFYDKGLSGYSNYSRYIDVTGEANGTVFRLVRKKALLYDPMIRSWNGDTVYISASDVNILDGIVVSDRGAAVHALDSNFRITGIVGAMGGEIEGAKWAVYAEERIGDHDNWLFVAASKLDGGMYVQNYGEVNIADSDVIPGDAAYVIDLNGVSTAHITGRIVFDYMHNKTAIYNGADRLYLHGAVIVNNGTGYTFYPTNHSIFVDVSNADTNICAAQTVGMILLGGCTGCDSGHHVYWYSGDGKSPFGPIATCSCAEQASSFSECGG